MVNFTSNLEKKNKRAAKKKTATKFHEAPGPEHGIHQMVITTRDPQVGPSLTDLKPLPPHLDAFPRLQKLYRARFLQNTTWCVHMAITMLLITSMKLVDVGNLSSKKEPGKEMQREI